MPVGNVAYSALFDIFEPCIPIAADPPPSGPGWVHEIKHDGYQLIARPDDASVRLLTRNGNALGRGEWRRARLMTAGTSPRAGR